TSRARCSLRASSRSRRIPRAAQRWGAPPARWRSRTPPRGSRTWPNRCFPEEAVVFRKARRLHFVGIGGSGMSGIAEVLVNLGYPVSGSDLAANPATRRLRKLGAKVQRGHRSENVRDADVVVVSSAVREDNPEIVEARR